MVRQDTRSDLRTRLRKDTAASHHALDATVSAFDLTQPAGLTAFLSMQHMALTALLPVSQTAAAYAMMSDLRARVNDDLTTLDATLIAAPDPAIDLDSLAIDYVLIGSRLGTAILRQRWATSTDPNVVAAKAYFSAPRYIELWHAFCDHAGQISASGARGDKVVADANTIFDLYQDCAARAAPHQDAAYA